MKNITEMKLETLTEKYGRETFVTKVKRRYPAHALRIPESLNIRKLCRMIECWEVEKVIPAESTITNVWVDPKTPCGVKENEFLWFPGLSSFCVAKAEVDSDDGTFSASIGIHGAVAKAFESAGLTKTPILYGAIVKVRTQATDQDYQYRWEKSLDYEDLSAVYEEFQSILRVVLESANLELLDIPEEDPDALI